MIRIVSNIYKSRHILKSLLIKDIKARYAGSVLGPLWVITTPLYQIFLYTFIFSTILRVRFDDGGTSSFVVYLLAGLIPWLFFSEATIRGASSFLENGNIIKKVKFPAEVCVVSAILSAVVTFSIYLILYSTILIYMGHFNPQTFPLIILPFIIQVLLIFGLSLGLGSIAVFFRDITQMIGMFINLFFFLTPIVYPASIIPENVKWLFHINPFYFIIEIYRSLLVKGIMPDINLFFYPAIFSIVIFAAGYYIFHKTKSAFMDIL